jgi:penicillin-binding protein 1A
VLLLVVVFVALAAALGVAALSLAQGTPSLASVMHGAPAQTTVIYDSAGKPIAELHGAIDRVIVPASRLPQSLKEATIAVEDKRFYSDFHGIDPEGIIRAAVDDLASGHAAQGASTITEQYVKNAFMGGYDDSLTLKVHEAVLAWELSDRWSRDRILAAYLNTVYYGDGAYGAQAAAETYFHKNVWQLSLGQSALLAGLPQDPSGYSPIYDPGDALARRNVVLADMAAQGYITATQETRLVRAPVLVYHTLPPDVQPAAAYFVDYLESELVQHFGAHTVFEGGLRVYTGFDSAWQNDALRVVEGTVETLDFGFKPSAALVAIDPATGYIRAMVGGFDFSKQQFNLASQAKRQPGSAMKPFVLAAAVEQGLDPFTTYYSSQSPVVIPMGPFAAPWVVRGDGPGGPETVAQAMTISDNAVFARLSVDVGPANTVRVAHAMGITSPLAAVPSITLGTSVVSPLEMADAYATFADGGIHHVAQAVVKVVAPDGKVLWKPSTTGDRAIPAGVASTVTQVLELVASRGTGVTTATYFPYPRAGKTGTTENSWDVWYVGYTPQLATSVWMGDMEADLPMDGAYGEYYCAPMWAQFTAAALADDAHPDFPVVSWAFTPWHGAHATSSPPASPSTTPSTSSSPSPSVTITAAPPSPSATPTAAPSPSPTVSASALPQ